MTWRADLLKAVLSHAKERDWQDTTLATSLGVSSAVLSNWKNRKEISKDAIEPALRMLGMLPALNGGKQGANSRMTEIEHQHEFHAAAKKLYAWEQLAVIDFMEALAKRRAQHEAAELSTIEKRVKVKA